MNQAEKQELSRSMARLAKGDRTAFELVFRVSWVILRSFAIKFLASDADGEDAAQEALLKIFNRAHQYQPELDALTWMLTITVYECKTYRQKKNRSREVYDQTETVMRMPSNSIANNPESWLVDEQLKKAVQESLGQLSESERETILISILDGQRPDIPAATYRKRLQRALVKFKQVWGEAYDE